MRKDMMDILVCPVDKGTLTLAITQENADEVVEGTLTCGTCKEVYPIHESIPNLLPPDLRRAMEAGQQA
ncbi:MAG TPA: methytransferase partner Trm112 [Dehalococcoidia bacterium]|jgi:uncharacterized protein YbaR (Trm112 family)|nr:methytransferase partner Trm112 [Dehalococcoidia bacterium]